jgi:hypothetical protein
METPGIGPATVGESGLLLFSDSQAANRVVAPSTQSHADLERPRESTNIRNLRLVRGLPPS